jgi:poly(hydroxyalkanoate) depolymerase family esterase
MKPLHPRDMADATHLTRSGRLSEAVALIQSVLRGRRPNERPQTHVSDSIALPAAVLELHAADVPPVADAPTATIPAPGVLEGTLGRLEIPLPGLPGLRSWQGRGAAPADIAPAAGQFVSGTFSSEAGTRAFKLYVPSGAPDARRSRPLIVMLHGCTQSPDDFAAGTRMNFAAEEHGCLVVYPEQHVSANAQKCWNWFKPIEQQRGGGEPALIAGITRQIMRDYDVDAARVYVAGLSAGGAAAAIMGETYPELYAAVGVHSGLACGAARDLPSAFAAMSGNGPVRVGSRVSTRGAQVAEHDVPTIVFHGDRDTTVHPRNGAEVVARAGGGVEVLSEARTTPHQRQFTRSIRRDETGRSVLELWEIHGAGHAWSGGSASGSFTDPNGPDATREMLRFFLEHAHEPA